MEYKFRGKRVDNGEWVYGYCAVSVEMFILVDNGISIGGFEMFKVIPETVGQYIGLKDKNGIKIFVGDRLRINSIDFEWDSIVIFWNGCFVESYSHWCIGSYKPHELEVIGNKHDSTELIEYD